MVSMHATHGYFSTTGPDLLLVVDVVVQEAGREIEATKETSGGEAEAGHDHGIELITSTCH